MVSGISSDNYLNQIESIIAAFKHTKSSTNASLENENMKQCTKEDCFEQLQEAYDNLLNSSFYPDEINNEKDFQTYITTKLIGEFFEGSFENLNETETKSVYSEFISSIDWSKEYQKYTNNFNNYLESLGCNSREEFAILNQTPCNNIEQLKNFAQSSLSYILMNGMIRNPKMANAPQLVDELINSVPLENLAAYVNSSSNDLEKSVHNAQDLLKKVSSSGFSVEELNSIIEIIDKLPEQIDEEKKMFERNNFTDYSVYYQQYNRNMISKYELSGQHSTISGISRKTGDVRQ